MPHILVQLYPGRDEDAKRKLAEFMQRIISVHLAIDPSEISVSYRKFHRTFGKDGSTKN